MSEPALRTEKLTKRFGGLTAVDDLSFSLAGGRLHAIIGPNGAGKTTLFNLISGLLAPDAGQVFFHGRDITGFKPHADQPSRHQAHAADQERVPAAFAWRTTCGSPATPGSASCIRSVRQHAIATPQRRWSARSSRSGFPRSPERQAGTLSYGDVALLEIGMALISAPRLLLLDEPTCGMSPAETERAVGKIRELARAIDIVIIEHDMEVVFEIADDITVMAQGAILASGRPKEIADDERVREAYLGRPEDEDYVEEAVHA